MQIVCILKQSDISLHQQLSNHTNQIKFTMTLDKIKHYIGADLFASYGVMNKEQLEKALTACEAEIMRVVALKTDDSCLFKLQVELQLINYRLELPSRIR